MWINIGIKWIITGKKLNIKVIKVIQDSQDSMNEWRQYEWAGTVWKWGDSMKSGDSMKERDSMKEWRQREERGQYEWVETVLIIQDIP